MASQTTVFWVFLVFQKPSRSVRSFPGAKRTKALWSSKMRHFLRHVYYAFAVGTVGNYGLRKNGEGNAFSFLLREMTAFKDRS